MGTPVDPIGWVIIGASLLSAGASTYGNMQQAAVQQGQFEAEARQRALEAQQADLQTHQISAQRLQELNANLGAIVAMRAGKNTLGDSPTGEAIIRSFTRESLGSRANEVLDARLRALSARNAVEAANQNARAARTQGKLAMIGGIADMAGAAYSSGFFRPGAGGLRNATSTGQKPPTKKGGGY